MLQSIRDRLTGPIVWFVIGLICIPFAFWGIESFRSGSKEPPLAKVGDQEITQAEFRQGYDQRYQQLQAMMGDAFRPQMIDQARFRKGVLDDMVQESVMRQYTQAAGYRASDAAVFDYLSSVPAFQENGKFSAQVYRDLLARRGMNAQTFEAQLRSSLVVDQLRESVIDSAFVSPQEAELAYRLALQSREIALATLPVEALKAGVQVSDAQVAEHYEANSSRYMAPERLKIAYIELDLEKLKPAGSLGADALKALYEAEKDSRFATPEERRARHILISFGADKAASKAKIEALAAQIKGGADFAELARKNSDDTGSKAGGGELGWVKRGMMVKSFEDALYALAPQQVSAPIETEFGWHLIQLEELKAPDIRPFSDSAVQAELLEVYRQRDAEKRFQEKSEQLEQLAFENAGSLEPVAQALELKVETTDWFTRAGGPGILANEAVREAAFSNEILNDGDNSKPLSAGPNRVVVLRKAEYEAPRQRAVAEVTDAIKEELRIAGAETAAKAKLQALLKAVREGQAFADAAAAAGASVQDAIALTRAATTPERAVVDAAFRLPRPADGKPTAGQVALANGDLAVILLKKVDEPTADAEAVKAGQKQLRDAVAGAEFGAVRKVLEKEIKVEVMQNANSDTAPVEGGNPGS